MADMAAAPSVVLVGRRLLHNENLGVAYLRSALEGAGAKVTIHYVNDAAELAVAAQGILEDPPQVVGLSLADGGSALVPLALGELLDEAGFAGHITSGGQFATLSREWLLQRYSWLDSVVRFAGERPLVELVERVAAGLSVEGVAGVTTRAGDGGPAPLLDPLPLATHPIHDDLPEILGHKAAHMAASRGCWARCQYCGPAALHALERDEGRRAAIPAKRLAAAGVGGLRRRRLDVVCDEMAQLWHEQGVRYFYFVDEHLLPYQEQDALAFLQEWQDALAEREVGRFGIGGMLRADRLTPAVARAFASLGMVRAFIGLEIASAEEARRFGRRPPTEKDLELLSVFAEVSVATVSNLMLLHPYSTPDTIRAGIQLLSRLPHGVFEATRMMVYHGTRLHEQMLEEGRLIGNPLRYGYTFEDPRIERFAEIFSRLRGEAFYNYSLACRTHDTHLLLALAHRLYSDRAPSRAVARLEKARRAVNALYVKAYTAALDLALDGGGFADAEPLVREMRFRGQAIEAELAAVGAIAERELPGKGRLLSPMRSAAAGAISFFVLTTTGCPKSPQSAGAEPTQAATAQPTSPQSAGPLVVIDPPDAGESLDAQAPASSCRQDPRPVQARMSEFLAQQVSCFSGNVVFSQGKASAHHSAGAGTGRGGILTLCRNTSATQGMETQVEAALSQRQARCIAEDAIQQKRFNLSIQGGARSDLQELANKIRASCPPNTVDRGFHIVLDASGKVVKVKSRSTVLSQCVKRALRGLSFPCLASFEVCPEFVIVE